MGTEPQRDVWGKREFTVRDGEGFNPRSISNEPDLQFTVNTMHNFLSVEWMESTAKKIVVQSPIIPLRLLGLKSHPNPQFIPANFYSSH